MIYSLFATKYPDFILSVDMIRFKFELRRDCLDLFLSHFNDIDRSDIFNYRPNFTDLKYRYLFKLTGKDSSCIVGFSFNGYKKDDKFLGFIEFNPNKILEEVLNDVFFIKNCSLDFSISRCDIAFDFPFNRSYVKLVRNNNAVYKLDYKSICNFTEYLGSRNTNNFLKIYNKTLESDLEYDCTRIEITLDYPFDKINLPLVYFYDCFLCDTSLNDTDFVLLDLLLKSDNPSFYLNKLGRVKREKYKKYFDKNFIKLFKNENEIYSLICKLKCELTKFFYDANINDVANRTLRKTLDFTN